MSLSPKLLLDTDTLSLYLRKDSRVVAACQEYLEVREIITFSIITRFEILRGMKSKGVTSQLTFFDLFCSNSEILAIDDNIIVRAADIYADLRKKGQIIGDADILIAASAMENALTVVTNNVAHFKRINGLQIINWNI